MLDKIAYIGNDLIKNRTFAQAITRTGEATGESLWFTHPPAVSHLCIHLPSGPAGCGGLKMTDILDEPSVICSGKDVAIIRVVYSPGVRPMASIDEMGMADCDYLAYRTHTDPPSLDVLPSPKPNVFHPWEIGFSPGEGEDFILAVLRAKPYVHLQYNLHVFSSKTNTWTTRLAMREPPWPGYRDDDYLDHESSEVMTLGGGLLGWVDLWRGILLCSVHDTDPVVRYVEFPKPMDGNMRQYLQKPARTFRDVVFTDGVIKLVEMEDHVRSDVPISSRLNVQNSMSFVNTKPYMPDGWTMVTWCRELSSDCWRLDSTAHVSTGLILSQLKRQHSESSALKSLTMAGPLWSMHGGDIVYLTAKAYFQSKVGWAIAFNTRNSTLNSVISFLAERYEFFMLAYQPFVLSKLTSSAAAVSCISEREQNSRNNRENSMVRVEGLDPSVTVDQLKVIVGVFGELSYLKILTDKQYGLVGFVRRSYAEQAISALNGLQIGGQCVRVSLQPAPSRLNKQRPRRMLRECNRNRYQPYACCYGVSRIRDRFA